MTEGIEHKGHAIIILRRAAGWRVYIRPPDAPMTHAEFPQALSREQVIAEATRIVDETIAAARATRGRR
jgi:hypothetical protein